MKKLDTSRSVSLRALGGRSPAPAVSVWGPILAKILLAALAAGVLAVIGLKAGASPAGTGPAAAPSVPSSEPADADAGTSSTSVAPPVIDGGTEQPAGSLPDGRIVLNVAGEEDLVKLPGIGPTRARAILALRHRLGRFRAVEDILRVRGIGRKTLRRLRPSLLLDAPRAPSAEKDAG
jgi:competence protein ComEA